MQSWTRYLDGKKFETLIGGHRIVCDQHASEGGTDAGVTPPELLLASLGSCAGHYAAEYLRARSLPLTGLQVHVSAEKGMRPARLASFRIEVDVNGIEERHRQGLLRAVKACLIHNTLTTVPAIKVEISDATQALSPRGCMALVTRHRTSLPALESIPMGWIAHCMSVFPQMARSIPAVRPACCWDQSGFSLPKNGRKDASQRRRCKAMNTVILSLAFFLAFGVSAASNADKAARDAKMDSEVRYNTATVVDFKATVTAIRDVPKTEPVDGLYLTVKTEISGAFKIETFDVYVGPADFVKAFEITFAKGDKVQVIGSKVNVDGVDIVLAREVSRQQTTIMLRDKGGEPFWKNWTKSRQQ